MDNDKQTEIVTKPFKSTIDLLNGLLDEELIEMFKDRAWYWQYKQETAKLYPENYLKETNVLNLPQEERSKIEEILKSEDNQNPAGKMIERFLYDCFFEIGAFMYPVRNNDRQSELSELIIEAVGENTKKERREEIERLIKEDEALNILMYVRGFTRFLFERIVKLTEELEQNETYLKITGSKPVELSERDGIDLYALGVSTHQTMDILKEYENHLKRYIHSYTYRIDKYRTKFIKTYTTTKNLDQIREEDGITITDVPEKLLDTTLDGYTGALRAYRPTTNKTGNKPNLAGLIPIGNFSVENGRLLDVDRNDITYDFSFRLSRGELKAAIRGKTYDAELITVGLSILRAIYQDGEEINPEMVITVDQKELISRLYGEHNKYHLELSGAIAQRMRTVDAGTMGVIRTIRQGKEYHAYYPVIVFMGLDEEHQTLSFSLPYFWQLLKRIETDKRLIAERNGEYNKKHKRKVKEEDPEKIAVFHDLNKPELNYQRSPIAVAIVKEITQLIARVGYQNMDVKGVKWTKYKVNRDKKNRPHDVIPHIGIDELINRVPELEKKLKESKNATRYLKELFSYVWEYLKAYTTVTEKYPAIKFPGWNLEGLKDLEDEEYQKWIPTKTSIKKGHVFEFKLLTKEEQLEKK